MALELSPLCKMYIFLPSGNEGEVQLVYKQVERLVESGLAQEEIAVITPYNLQVCYVDC